jgi:hypothetical protein
MIGSRLCCSLRHLCIRSTPVIPFANVGWIANLVLTMCTRTLHFPPYSLTVTLPCFINRLLIYGESTKTKVRPLICYATRLFLIYKTLLNFLQYVRDVSAGEHLAAHICLSSRYWTTFFLRLMCCKNDP